MKCPKCGSKDLWTTTDQVSFYKSRIETDEAGQMEVHDGKTLDDGEWWIDPDAETNCDACDHGGCAKDFAEEQDKERIVESLDYFLCREIKSARATNRQDDAAVIAEILRRRGRPDLAVATRNLRANP